MPENVNDPEKTVIAFPVPKDLAVTSEGEPIPEQLANLPDSQRMSRSCQLRILAEAILGVVRKMEKEEAGKNGS